MGRYSDYGNNQPRSNNFRHGHRYGNKGRPTRTYRCWVCMLRRNKRKAEYFDIEVEESWKTFENFLSDVGVAPSELHTIDRIDGSKGYIKGNVRWATMHEQARNKSNNIWLDGLVLKDWCNSRGFNYKTVWRWFKEGFTKEQVIKKGELLWADTRIT